MRRIHANQIDTGRLQVSTTTNGRARPVPDAKISIFQANTDGNQIQLEELRTDISGQTIEIELPTPPLDYSLLPGSPMPYAQYDITIQANGYDTLAVRDIQVLPSTLALQDCQLSFAGLTTQQAPQETVTIDHHTLYYEYPEKLPEDPIKPLPPPTGFVVLDRVVVPETIVVHAGPPDSPAANYYVPFRDYIKNVASSEIYANWPDASIKANILAILSFTLNRVFTEWYRNKGKDFTITSSTAFDQAYFHGRNVFAEISRAVDEIFTTYITKPDIRQPLFSQYCDGVRVKRDGWLSQWGSKDMADRGLPYLDILRSYYGSTVYLDNAEKVAGIPKSYPGTPLRLGSTGDAVRTIQTQLNAIANNFPAINKQAADGVFGQATDTAVKKFQQIFNLTQDGVVGSATWYKISEIYVGVAKMAVGV
ncbi:MAG: peptidoglycan-binding protein [Defluviitaleaceae bacterium]|nr:peptidoglycan-binding protein [Defluviitaleaceae bacterium]